MTRELFNIFTKTSVSNQVFQPLFYSILHEKRIGIINEKRIPWLKFLKRNVPSMTFKTINAVR